jgi:hypothetical protein
MTRLVISFAIIAHGIGHLIGVSAAWTPIKMGFSDHSWIFSTGVNISSGIGRAFGFVWLITMVITITSGLGLLLRLDWWIPLAIVSALLSIFALITWFKAFPSSSDIAALLFDVIVLTGLLGPWSEKIIQILR